MYWLNFKLFTKTKDGLEVVSSGHFLLIFCMKIFIIYTLSIDQVLILDFFICQDIK